MYGTSFSAALVTSASALYLQDADLVADDTGGDRPKKQRLMTRLDETAIHSFPSFSRTSNGLGLVHYNVVSGSCW